MDAPRATQPAGKLVGQGRTADVYEHGVEQVLRRYRAPRDTEREVAAMEHARTMASLSLGRAR